VAVLVELGLAMVLLVAILYSAQLHQQVVDLVLVTRVEMVVLVAVEELLLVRSPVGLAIPHQQVHLKETMAGMDSQAHLIMAVAVAAVRLP